jgi:AAA family ATP:ADP antiporter
MTEKTGVVQQPEFSKLRASLWPIHGYEMKKFLPMGLIMFFVLFNYTILRDIKDVLIVTAPGAGSPVLGFLKGWLVMPSAILFVVLYTKLSNVFSQEKIFYYIVTAFITFFAAFAFFLYPNQALIHPAHETIAHLQATMPNLHFVFPIWGVWTYSVFYILAELWGSVLISLLFWQFANQYVRTNEAKRYYALFGLIANFALIASGETIKRFSKMHEDSGLSDLEAWGISLKYMMAAAVVCGVLAMLLYRWIHTNVLTDKRFYDPQADTKAHKDKPKLGIVDSAKLIFSNAYIGYIALLVVAYGISINLIEVVWKDQIRLAFPKQTDFAHFMGQFSQNTGIATILLIFFTKGIVRKFGWFTGAIFTPLMLIITGALFFAFVLCREALDPLMATMSLTAGAAFYAAWVGSVQNFLAKGTKYSQFDPTKEMAYIPLSQELRTKGKAAVDVIGGRLGKAMGGYIQNVVFMVTATKDVLAVAPLFAGVVAVIVASWVWAVTGLSRRYNKLIAEQEVDAKKRA